MTDQHSSRLRAVLDRATGNYKQLNGARDLGDYLNRERRREDEEVLTEPLLADLIETLLGFPRDAYFPQLGRSGLKPDFTPHDLVAHRFVLDAKSSTQDLAPHEPQIRAWRSALLERLVEGERLMPSELEAVLLPRDLDAFALWRGARVTEVTELLEEGRVLVEAVERLVCRLYDLPAELEEAVVRHAAERAVAGLPAEE